MSPEECDLRFLAVGHLSGQTLVEDAAERIDVRLGNDRAVLNLFRRHVVEGSDQLTGLRQVGPFGRVPRETEVGEIGAVAGLCLGFLGEQDVARLDVPVDEPFCVGCIECDCHLGEDRNRSLGLEADVFSKKPLEVKPFDVAHCQIQKALGLSCLVDGDHVGVFEGGCKLRLPEKTAAEALTSCELGGQNLQRDLTLEPGVLGEVNDTHSAAAELRLEPVAGKLATNAQV